MTVTQQLNTSICVSMSASASCIWDTVERRLSYMHAGVTNATQLFNLRLYVCFYVLHASGTLSRGGYCYMHAGASGVFLCTKTLPIVLSSSGAPRKRRFRLSSELLLLYTADLLSLYWARGKVFCLLRSHATGADSASMRRLATSMPLESIPAKSSNLPCVALHRGKLQTLQRRFPYTDHWVASRVGQSERGGATAQTERWLMGMQSDWGNSTC